MLQTFSTQHWDENFSSEFKQQAINKLEELEQELITKENLIYSRMLERMENEKDLLALQAMDQLIPVCKNYKEDLEKLLIKELEKKSVEAAKEAMIDYPIFSNYQLRTGLKGIELLNFDCYEHDPIVQTLRSLLTSRKAMELLESYKTISNMLTILQTKNLKQSEQPQQPQQIFMNFCTIFHKNRQLLEQDHDNKFKKLILFILKIITFGHIKTREKGEKIAENIHLRLWGKAKPESENCFMGQNFTKRNTR